MAMVTAQAAGLVAALYEIGRGRGVEEAALPSAAHPGRLSLGAVGDVSVPDRWPWTSQLLNTHSQRSTRCPHPPSGPTSPRPRPVTRPAASRGNYPRANAAGTANKINLNSERQISQAVQDRGQG